MYSSVVKQKEQEYFTRSKSTARSAQTLNMYFPQSANTANLFRGLKTPCEVQKKQ